jgi:hypothetical protein
MGIRLASILQYGTSHRFHDDHIRLHLTEELIHILESFNVDN